MRIRRRRTTRPDRPAAARPSDIDADVDVGSATAVGRRADNQDRCFVDAGLAVVSDGMGGYRGGARAAALSVDAVVATIGSRSSDDARATLLDAFAAANAAVRSVRVAEREVGEMGATLTAALVTDATDGASRWLVAHVGDSPAFLVTAESSAAVTTDHTRSAELVAAGVLTDAQAATHPGRHLLLRAIGPDPTVEVDLVDVALRRADALILGTDGLSGTLDAAEIGAIVRAEASAAAAATALVSTAVERGATDNVTAVVIRQVASSTA
jgi:protein phosphatase